MCCFFQSWDLCVCLECPALAPADEVNGVTYASFLPTDSLHLTVYTSENIWRTHCLLCLLFFFLHCYIPSLLGLSLGQYQNLQSGYGYRPCMPSNCSPLSSQRSCHKCTLHRLLPYRSPKASCCIVIKMKHSCLGLQVPVDTALGHFSHPAVLSVN